MNTAFSKAAAEFDVPRDLLVAVGYGETHLDGHGGEPSQANGYGVMHLVSQPKQQTLEKAAKLTGASVAELKKDTAANIRGAAAVLRAVADEQGLDATERDSLPRWYPVAAEYGAAANDRTARLYADTAYDLLNKGLRAQVMRQRAGPRQGPQGDAGPWQVREHRLRPRRAERRLRVRRSGSRRARRTTRPAVRRRSTRLSCM